MTLDSLRGTLTAYEMRIGQEKSSKGDVFFKASKGSKKHEYMNQKDLSNLLDEEESNFM